MSDYNVSDYGLYILSGQSKQYKQQLQAGQGWFHPQPVGLVTYMGKDDLIPCQLALWPTWAGMISSPAS